MGNLQEHHLENVGERETHRVDPEHHERFRDPDRLERLRPDELVGELNLSEGEVVLDVGCGDGLFFEPLSRAVGSTGRVIGLDIDEGMLDRARETIEKEGLDNVRVQLSDDSIDLEGDRADAALLVNVLHEMAYPRESLEELARVMKSGGTLLLHDRHKEETGEEGPPIHHLVSRDEAIDLLEGAGFERIRDLDWHPDMYTILFSR